MESEARTQIKSWWQIIMENLKTGDGKSHLHRERISYASRVYDERKCAAWQQMQYWILADYRTLFQKSLKNGFAQWLGVRYADLVNSAVSKPNLVLRL